MNIEETESKKYKGDKLSETVINSLEPFWKKLKKKGIKKSIRDFIPSMDIDKFVLNKIKSQLSKRRVIELGSNCLGRVDIQYRYDGIQVEPTGVLRLFIKKITITDSQILASLDSILNQIEEKYIINNEYIVSKIDEIIVSLSNTGIYKPKNSEEKTLYDLAMLILLDYYKINKRIPKWTEQALKNIEKGDFLESWISLLIDYISEVISKVSENIFINFKVTFDSLIIRTVLNRTTNKGQISRLLKILNIDVKEIIFNFAKSYVSPSFIRGIADILVNFVSDFLSTVDKKFENEDYKQLDYQTPMPLNITMSMGENFRTDRALRWYTGKDFINCFAEYSYTEDFEESFKIKSTYERVYKTVPTINLGLVSGYRPIELNKHSVCINNLKAGTVYYRIKSENGIESNTYSFRVEDKKQNFEFSIFTDSQGMVKQDYEIFLELLEKSFENNNSDFMVHLGDFVDDGNNEQYWRWVLDSKIWKQNICIPLSGNHEAKVSGVAIKAGVENSIIGHFNVQNIPFQNTSKGMYYSFEYNNTTFVVLNTNSDDNESDIDDIQYRWALDILKNSKSRWKIIFAHKTPYSNGPHSKDTDVKNMGFQIAKLAYQGEVDVIFGGHDHVYVRTSILSCGKRVDCEKSLSKFYKSSKHTTFINPYGSIFLVPGTSGVKNYKQDLSIITPAEKLLDLNNPVYSKVYISDSELLFKAYLYDSTSKSFNVVDSFSIEKRNKKPSEIDSNYVSKLIESIPDMPWIDNTEKINKTMKIYNSLGYTEKVRVNNSKKLFNAVRLNKNYLDIINSEICRVSTKSEFFSALRNRLIGTIIIDCDELRFSNKFYTDSKIVIDRPICIRGYAKLTNIRFVNKSMLILSDSICIDNTHRVTSLRASQNIFELYNESTLIINDNVSLNSDFGIGTKGRAIEIIGESCNVYLNSSSTNFVSKGFIQSLDSTSHIVVNSGKYLSHKNRPTFLVNCNLNINGGFIRSIKGLESSNINIEGGIIGENNSSKFLVPIQSSGKVKIESGKIRAKNGVSISMCNSKEFFISKTSSHSLVDIDGKIIYN